MYTRFGRSTLVRFSFTPLMIEWFALRGEIALRQKQVERLSVRDRSESLAQLVAKSPYRTRLSSVRENFHYNDEILLLSQPVWLKSKNAGEPCIFAKARKTMSIDDEYFSGKTFR
ncbi:hypothetical protein NPIL_540501 [Nephila pilipes]|uniref:Uncharacterized protein n=1 Tax=Nephila pilipes TaxID=299642 RepID=A0A8X6U1F6_NEPPI|nr:hypothetical protein NPIL_540501 [Nephila pilipes]